MMTQARNGLNISSSPGEESLAKKASARKQAGRQNNGIGHVGLRATNPPAAAEFYRDVLGMEIVGGSTPDHPLGVGDDAAYLAAHIAARDSQRLLAYA
jgi:catechol-2,3-dioxygenase